MAASTSRYEASAASNVLRVFLRFYAAFCTPRRSTLVVPGGKGLLKEKLERKPDARCQRDARRSTPPLMTMTLLESILLRHCYWWY